MPANEPSSPYSPPAAADMPAEDGVLPMRWPFRVAAGIFAIGFFAPYTVYLALTVGSSEYITVAILGLLTIQWLALAYNGKGWPRF